MTLRIKNKIFLGILHNKYKLISIEHFTIKLSLIKKKSNYALVKHHQKYKLRTLLIINLVAIKMCLYLHIFNADTLFLLLTLPTC